MSLHERSRKLAVAELDFDLTTTERAKLRDHLGACADCRAYADGVRRDAVRLAQMTAAATGLASAGGAERTVRDSIMVAAAARRGPGTPVRVALQLAMLLLLAALVVGFAAVVYVGSRHQLKAVDPRPGLVGTVTGGVDTTGRLPPEPDYCLTSSGDHRTPDCRIGLAAGAGSIWTTAGQGVVRVAPATDEITAAIPLASDPRDLVFLDGSLYVATWAGAIERVDPETNTVVGSIQVSAQPLDSMASSPEGDLWVGVRGTGEAVRVDPRLGVVVARVAVGGEPYDVASSGGSVWVSDRTHDRVTRVDVSTNRAASVVMLPGFEPRDEVATPAGIWVASAAEMALIDPVTGVVTRRLPAQRLANLGSGASALWAASMANTELQRADAETGDLVGRISLAGRLDLPDIEATVIEADGLVWIAVYGSPNLLRVEPGP